MFRVAAESGYIYSKTSMTGTHQLARLPMSFGMFQSILLILTFVMNTKEKLVRKFEVYTYNYLTQIMLALIPLWVGILFVWHLATVSGNFAVMTAISVVAVLASVTYFPVCEAMRRDHLIKG